MIHGFSENDIIAIIGNMVLANNRLLMEVQLRDQQIAKLKQEIEQLEEKVNSDGRLVTTKSPCAVS